LLHLFKLQLPTTCRSTLFGTRELRSTFSSRIDDGGCIVDGNNPAVYWCSQNGGRAEIQPHCLARRRAISFPTTHSTGRDGLQAEAYVVGSSVDKKGAASKAHQLSAFGWLS
jgi:hypothetical protein